MTTCSFCLLLFSLHSFPFPFPWSLPFPTLPCPSLPFPALPFPAFIPAFIPAFPPSCLPSFLSLSLPVSSLARKLGYSQQCRERSSSNAVKGRSMEKNTERTFQPTRSHQKATRIQRDCSLQVKAKPKATVTNKGKKQTGQAKA